MRDNHQAASPRGRRFRFELPKGTTDAHFHVFGPARSYRYAAGREYTPADALPETARDLFEAAGIARCVLVQASVYGRDNRRHIDAAGEMGMPAKVVVVTDPDTPDRDLERMDKAGARGVRFIMSHRGGLAVEDLARFSDRLSAIGWHVQLMLKPDQLVELEDRIARLACPVMIDHLGMIDPAGGLEQPAFRALLRLLDAGNCHVKLSGYYRLSAQGAPYGDLSPVVATLLRAAPERIVWGSDWPHPHFSGPIPSLADLIAPLFEWMPDEALRKRILVDNAAAFYGFGTPADHQFPKETAVHG